MKFRFKKELIFSEDFDGGQCAKKRKKDYIGIYIPANVGKSGQIHTYIAFNDESQIRDIVKSFKTKYPNYRYKFKVFAHPVFKDYL